MGPVWVCQGALDWQVKLLKWDLQMLRYSSMAIMGWVKQGQEIEERGKLSYGKCGNTT